MPKQKRQPVDLTKLPPLDLKTAKKLCQGQWVYSRQYAGPDGFPRRYRVTSTKCWKRDLGRIEVHLSWGLYGHFVLDAHQLSEISLYSRPEEAQAQVIPADGYADGGEAYTNEELAIINGR